MEPLDGWTGGVPGAEMCVRAYGRRVSVVEVRLFCACTRGERLLGVTNIIFFVSLPLYLGPLYLIALSRKRWAAQGAPDAE
jgi:hypothetical protein